MTLKPFLPKMANEKVPHSAPEYKDETMTVYQVPIHSESESQISLEYIGVVPNHGV